MAQNDNIIPMNFDADFYKKMGNQKLQQQEYKKAAEYFGKVLEMSPQDFDVTVNYALCLSKIGAGQRAETLFYEYIIKDEFVAQSFFQLSQLNIELNEPNKAFLFGINYVLISEDEAYHEELENMFEVSYDSGHDINLESQLFAVQLIFQYLFSQGRLPEAKDYIKRQEDEVQQHRIVRNLLAMCYLYLSEYDIAKEMFETLLAEDKSDMHALCHYTLLLYNINETEKYQKYIHLLSKVMPMNEDETFKLGIVLSYLKEYDASQRLLVPLYKKGKFLSLQMYNALSFNYYYLGQREESEFFWSKLQEISKVDVGYAPWKIEESKNFFNQHILPLLLNDDSHRRIYGIFLLNQLKGREVLLTEEIWSILEGMNDYEKLYLTYLIQDLKLNKLDFVHRGLVQLYNIESLKDDEELFIVWIDQAEAIIAEDVDLTHVSHYIAAFVYNYYQNSESKVSKQQVMDWFDVTRYRLNQAIDYLLSI
ncbi:tetratricopeptide repeat protein [Staphylococcus kloosii]|uniref:tetratricopeptide repeat protein n=1 Tax=Staphylococcus kloosii TaxID=29384 RepID=UPI001E405CD6|nr:tetratricopeptide repeat protein [Staphylococcus kloosii]MCD8878057.1 tetratricopeptide repeat protein [Staphylococcus kloosii]